MSAATVPVPAHELLPQETDRDHQELQVEPLVAEPYEQVCAQDDRKRPETQDPLVPAAPAEQGVERVCKDDLCEDQAGFIVDFAPIPSPVRVDCELNGRLDVVMLPGNEVVFEPPSIPGGGARQPEDPSDQRGSEAPERKAERGDVLEIEPRKRKKQDARDERNPERRL